MILRAYKTEITVNNKQQTLLLQHIGCARWAYNWALAKKKESFDKKEKIPNAIELHRELNKLKQSDVPWMYQSSKTSPQNALRDCDKAFQNFFTRCKKKVKGKKGFPKFKSKKNEKQSFRLDGAISIESDCIKLPRIGKLKLAEKDYIPTDCKILSATVSKRAGKWFVSVQVETPDREPSYANNEAVGIDLGIKTLATCSDGTTYKNPRTLKKNLKRLIRKQKQLSRKKKGSKNYGKAKQKLAKLHYHVSNIRKDCLHKVTSKIINENQVIVLEDLKVSNMMKNHCLAQAISDVGLFEFRRQIEYKAKWNNRKVIFADTFYASSKLCSCCGWKNSDLKLTDRVFECKMCDMKLDRDLNASLNLKQIYTGSSSGIYASGDGSSSNVSLVSPSLNEEFNKKIESLYPKKMTLDFCKFKRTVLSCKQYGIPAGNISIWDTSAKGVEETGRIIRETTDALIQNQRSGTKTKVTTLFSLNTQNLTEKSVKSLDVLSSKDYTILHVRNDSPIKEFIESWKMEFRQGANYYQLTKKEKIQPGKFICIQEKSTGKVYSGANARQILGLPSYEVKIEAADHPKYNIFVQSTSVNRKLIAGTQLLVMV